MAWNFTQKQLFDKHVLCLKTVAPDCVLNNNKNSGKSALEHVSKCHIKVCLTHISSWLCTYMCQLNPLIGPEMDAETIKAIVKEWGRRTS